MGEEHSSGQRFDGLVLQSFQPHKSLRIYLEEHSTVSHTLCVRLYYGHVRMVQDVGEYLDAIQQGQVIQRLSLCVSSNRLGEEFVMI